MTTSDLIQLFIGIAIADLVRYILVAGGAHLLCWVIFKTSLHHRFIQKPLPSTKRLMSEFRYSMSTILIFAIVAFFTGALVHFGYLSMYSDAAIYGYGYLFVSFVLSIILHDTYFYWTHRLMHHPRLYKHIHKVHHYSTNPSPWASYSFHPIEACIQALIFPVLLFCLSLHGITLLAFLLYMILRNVYGHLGVELLPNRFVRSRWLNWHTTSTHHNLHHRDFHSNYGLYFSWWDRIMNTEHPSYHEWYEKVTQPKSTLHELKE